jgi:hypothetical protein
MRLLSLPGMSQGGNTPYSPASPINPNRFQASQLGDTFSRATHAPAPTQATGLYFSGKGPAKISPALRFNHIIPFCRQNTTMNSAEVARALNQKLEVKNMLPAGREIKSDDIHRIRKDYVKNNIYTFADAQAAGMKGLVKISPELRDQHIIPYCRKHPSGPETDYTHQAIADALNEDPDVKALLPEGTALTGTDISNIHLRSLAPPRPTPEQAQAAGMQGGKGLAKISPALRFKHITRFCKENPEMSDTDVARALNQKPKVKNMLPAGREINSDDIHRIRRDYVSKGIYTFADAQAAGMKGLQKVSDVLRDQHIIPYCRDFPSGLKQEWSRQAIADALNEDPDVKAHLPEGTALNKDDIKNIYKRHMKVPTLTTEQAQAAVKKGPQKISEKLMPQNASASGTSSSQGTGTGNASGVETTSYGQTTSTSHVSSLARQMGGMPAPSAYDENQQKINAWIIEARLVHKLPYAAIQTHYPHYSVEDIQTLERTEREAQAAQAAYLAAKEKRKVFNAPSPEAYNQACKALNKLRSGIYTKRALVNGLLKAVQKDNPDMTQEELAGQLTQIARTHQKSLIEAKHQQFYDFLNGDTDKATVRKPKDFKFKPLATPSQEPAKNPLVAELSQQGQDFVNELHDTQSNFQPSHQYPTLQAYLQEQVSLLLTEQDISFLHTFTQQHPDSPATPLIASAIQARYQELYGPWADQA